MEFKDALEILWRRRTAVLYVLLLGVIAGLAAYLLVPRMYQATASTLIVGQAVGRDPSMSSLDMPTLVQSESVIDAVKRKLHLRVPLPVMQSRIAAKISLGSSVMPITYQDPDPRQAVVVTNALAAALVSYYRQISGTRYDDLARFLNNGMQRERSRMEDLDRKLQEAAVKDPAVGQAQATDVITGRLLALQVERQQIEATLAGHQAEAAIEARQLEQVRPLIDQELADRDPAYKALADQAGKDRAQLRVDRAQYTDKYPGLPGLEEKVARESAALTAAAKEADARPPVASATFMALMQNKGRTDAQLAADRAQLTAIDDQIGQAQAHLTAIPGLGVKIAALRRDRDAASAAYQQMAQRLTTTLSDQAEAAALGSVVVIDRARSAQSVVSKHGALLVAGAVLGFLVLGITLAFLLEITDVRLRTPRSVEDLYGRPVIATIGRA